MKKLPGLLTEIAAILAGAMLLSAPAVAQMSMGYKFLEAVRKKDGALVTDALAEPGSTTLINTRDVTSGDTAMHIVTARRHGVSPSYVSRRYRELLAILRVRLKPLLDRFDVDPRSLG